MQKNAVTYCSTVGVVAAFSLFFRWIQNQAAFETDTGLMIAGAFWSKLALVVCLISLAAIVLMVRALWYKGYYPAQNYTDMIKGKQEWLRRITRGIAGVMVFGTAICFFIAGYSVYSTMLRTLCVLAIAAAWAFVKLSEVPFAEKKSELKQTVYVGIIAAMYVYWLIVSYRTNSANPSVWNYAVEIFAICASILGTFYFASYAFENPRPYAALGCLMTGAFLSLVSLLDDRNIGMTIMLVAGAAMQLYFVWMIISSMSEEWPEEYYE